jgi:hypothetical protein
METEVVCEKCMHINIFKERLLTDEEGEKYIKRSKDV